MLARLSLVVMILLGACSGGPAYGLAAERWFAADVLFHRDPHWLGGDIATTIVLDDERTLWLFGDSFVATEPGVETLIHNSVAVMTGHDPLTATMEHAWQRGAEPGPMFPLAGTHYLWPLTGVRTPDGPLIILLAEVRPVIRGGEMIATRAVRIADPSGPPSTWVIEEIAVPPSAFAGVLATCGAVDGDHFVGIALESDRGYLVRWSLDDLARGDLGRREWRAGGTWMGEDALAAPPPVAIAHAGAQCALAPEKYFGWVYLPAGDHLTFRPTSDLTNFRYGEDIWLFPEGTAPLPTGVAIHSALAAESYAGVMTYVDPGTYAPHVMRLMYAETAVE